MIDSRQIAPAVAEIELQLLLEAVYRVAGYDFREYAPGTLKRRVSERVRAEGVNTFSGLQEKLLHEPEALGRFVYAMSVNSADGLFRDPGFFADVSYDRAADAADVSVRADVVRERWSRR